MSLKYGPLLAFIHWGKSLENLPYHWSAHRVINVDCGWEQYTIRIHVQRLLIGYDLPIKRISPELMAFVRKLQSEVEKS